MIESNTCLDKHNVPYALFSDNVDFPVLEQLEQVIKAPGILRVALMPDFHLGYTSPVGSVVETDGIAYPAIVGYDIGCGILSTPIDIKYELVWDNAVAIRNQILEALHVGVGRNYAMKGHVSNTANDKFGEFARDIGTLGGGNHFVEIGVNDEDKRVWVTVHSGSRGFGHAIGSKYMKLAAEINDSTNIESMNGISRSHPLYAEYLKGQQLAVEFAHANRRAIMNNVIKVLEKAYGPIIRNTSDEVSCIHNFMTPNMGNRLIHRKGATRALEGELVTIPGSMRDGVIIGIGKGNTNAIYSCSHGAGRVVSRNRAKKEFSLEEFVLEMSMVPGAGVSNATLDESPMAYKNIFEVMQLQESAVEVLHVIRPIVNVKG